MKSIEGLYIINLNLAAVRKSVKVEAEMERLANRLIKPIGMPSDIMNVHSGHDKQLLATICSLNVRSIVSKLNDMKCDKFVQSVDILCICETRLTPSHQTPKVIDGHNVMISCKDNVTYSLIDIELNNNGIENITGSFVMRGFPIILSMIYRPPQVPMNNLLNTLNVVFCNVNENELMKMSQ